MAELIFLLVVIQGFYFFAAISLQVLLVMLVALAFFTLQDLWESIRNRRKV
ncbi:MAG TPA: hypothetical protein VJZ94_03465 [Candidatus Paceibacterota bacterium]|nr:hypothetical protein [Candidatus Paceibacterota bacterium]